MIRLFIIEDHATIIVSGLKRLFSPARDGIEISGYSENVEEAIEKADINSFDIIFLDLWLENKLPLLNIRMLKKHFPGKPIIIYTSEDSYAWKQRMFNEGAIAYLNKRVKRAEIKAAVENAAKNESYFPVTMSQVTEKKNVGSDKKEKKILTPVRKEILVLLSKGYTHKAIAKHLCISESKVDKTLRTLRNKFDVNNNLELLLLLNVVEKFETKG